MALYHKFDSEYWYERLWEYHGQPVPVLANAGHELPVPVHRGSGEAVLPVGQLNVLGTGEHPGVALHAEPEGGHWLAAPLPLLSTRDWLDLSAENTILYHLLNSLVNIADSINQWWPEWQPLRDTGEERSLTQRRDWWWWSHLPIPWSLLPSVWHWMWTLCRWHSCHPRTHWRQWPQRCPWTHPSSPWVGRCPGGLDWSADISGH